MRAVPARLPGGLDVIGLAAHHGFGLETDVAAAVDVYSPIMRIELYRPARGTADVLLATAVAGAGVLEVALNRVITPRGPAYVLVALMGAALIARRRFPVPTLVTIATLSATESLVGVPMDAPWVPLAATMTAVYSVSLLTTLDGALLGLAVACLGFTVGAVHQDKVGNIVFGMVFIVPLFVVGRGFRMRTAHVDELQREQAEQARAAVEAERRRIARDLHDVISHSLGIVVLQAGAAEQVVRRDPEKARELLGEIRATGQRAVAELGTLLTLARSAPADSLEPSPSIEALAGLVKTMRRTGMDVTLRVQGVPRPLPPAVEVSTYRIVQEALTNAAKHSGGGRAVVTLGYEPSILRVEVLDDGPGTGGADGTGSGLVGIRERAELFGGTVDLGPCADGGWRVRATMPVPL